MKKIYRAVKYMRTSCPDNETEYRDSIANQRRLINVFLENNQDIIAISERMDDGLSGLFFERPALKAMLEEIEAKQVDCVIVKDLSRLGRDYIEVGRLLRNFFPLHQVRLISLDDHIDSTQLDGFDKVFALLKSIFSEQYCHDISLKTRSALEVKCRQGFYIGAVPIYGYRRSGETKYQLEPDVHTADVVYTIFQMKLQGMNAAKIAEALNERQIPSPLAYKRKQGIACPTGGFSDTQNPLWSVTTILRILKDETYTGTLVQRKQQRPSYKAAIPVPLDKNNWIRAEQAHKAIVSKQDYTVVQELLQLNTRSAPMHAMSPLFSGLLICRSCGQRITRKIVKHQMKKYIYYCCAARKSSGCGFIGMMEEKHLYNLVFSKLRDYIAQVEKLFSKLSGEQVLDNKRAGAIAETAKIDGEIKQLNHYRQNLSEALLAEVLVETEFCKLQSHYDNEICRLEKEASMVRKELFVVFENLHDNTGWAQELLHFKGLKILTRESIVKTIEYITVVSKTEVEICFRYQSEMNILIQYDEKGGHRHGKEKQKTK